MVPLFRPELLDPSKGPAKSEQPIHKLHWLALLIYALLCVSLIASAFIFRLKHHV